MSQVRDNPAPPRAEPPLGEGPGRSLARGLLWLLILALALTVVLFAFRRIAGIEPPGASPPSESAEQPAVAAPPRMLVTEDTQRIDTAK